jgi:hypothetical protein
VSTDPVYARNPDAIGVDVAGEIVLLNSKNWTYLDFDDIGSRVWVLLKEPHTLPALVEKLVDEYAVEPGACRHDTEIFLQEMIGKGAVLRQG